MSCATFQNREDVVKSATFTGHPQVEVMFAWGMWRDCRCWR